MVRPFFLLLIFILQLSPSFAKDQLSADFEALNHAIKKSGTFDYSENCASCQQSQNQSSTVYSPHNKKTIELTVLSQDRVNDVFKKLKQDEDIPFNYPYEGCYARAHKMAQLMDDMGIVSGKAFIEGELYMNMKEVGEIGWSYHVASLVLVKKGSKLVPTIIDPAIFDRPVPYEEWKALLLKNPKSKKSSEYFTKRFNYDPETRHADLRDYNEDELDNMVATNRSNARLADMMEMTEQQNTKGLKK